MKLSNNLINLYESTVALHERFNTSQTVQQSLERFVEEYTETLDALNSENVRDDLKHEFVDCLVTVIGVFRSISKSDNNLECLSALFFVIKSLYELYVVYRKQGLEAKDLEQPILDVIKKNDSKTLKTHYLSKETGKITRIGK